MRAAVSDRYGPPEVVRVTEVDKPAIGDNDLLVRVHATTVNRTDCGYRTPTPAFARLFFGLRGPKVTVLGNEFAGEVEAVGSAVTSFAVGERLFGYVEGPFGAHAEYLAIAEDASIATIPDSLSYEDAAPMMEGSHYALGFLRKAKVERGRDVMVYGATGAIGSAAVQLAKSHGATVTGVCATEHLQLVKELGAERVIDYTVDDFASDGQTYDAVLDAVGKTTFGRCRRLLKPGGTYISSDLGPMWQNPLLALVTPLLRGKSVRFPIPHHDQEMARYFKDLVEAGEFKPVIDRTYRFDQIVDAYRYVETGQKIGNVVIVID